MSSLAVCGGVIVPSSRDVFVASLGRLLGVFPPRPGAGAAGTSLVTPVTPIGLRLGRVLVGFP